MARRWFATVVVATALMLPGVPAGAGTSVPGGRIVFVDGLGGTGLWAIAADGTNRVQLVNDEHAAHPRWAPDGSGLAFTVSRRYYNYRIDFTDENGGNRTTLIGPGELPDGWAIGGFAWSPDASRFVVALWEVEGHRQRIYVTPRNGSSFVRIALGAEEPDWSSTGRIVAVVGGDVVTMDPDGGNRTTVVDGGGNYGPRWSPDGSAIVLARLVGGLQHADVFVVDADGSGLTNLTNSPDVYDWSPSWSPTGRHIAWAPSPPGDWYGYADLWRMRAAGGGKTQVTATDDVDEYRPDWVDTPDQGEIR